MLELRPRFSVTISTRRWSRQGWRGVSGDRERQASAPSNPTQFSRAYSSEKVLVIYRITSMVATVRRDWSNRRRGADRNDNGQRSCAQSDNWKAAINPCPPGRDAPLRLFHPIQHLLPDKPLHGLAHARPLSSRLPEVFSSFKDGWSASAGIACLLVQGVHLLLPFQPRNAPSSVSLLRAWRPSSSTSSFNGGDRQVPEVSRRVEIGLRTRRYRQFTCHLASG